MSDVVSERDLERWQDLLDQGMGMTVLDEVLKVLEVHPDNLDVVLVCSWAWSSLGDRWGAYQQLRAAQRYHGDSVEFLQELAETAFLACQFQAARDASEAALRRDPECALAQYVSGLLLERDGQLEQADVALERASQLDPEDFPRSYHLEDGDFAKVVEEAIASLGPRFAAAMENVRVVEEPVPREDLLAELGAEGHPFLLGLYLGDAGSRSVLDPQLDEPPTVYLFRRNIERIGENRDEIREQVRITLFHEVGHHLGFEEDGLQRLGLE
jgi:predicted Zn-dependent protease with MMP-like domain